MLESTVKCNYNIGQLLFAIYDNDPSEVYPNTVWKRLSNYNIRVSSDVGRIVGSDTVANIVPSHSHNENLHTHGGTGEEDRTDSRPSYNWGSPSGNDKIRNYNLWGPQAVTVNVHYSGSNGSVNNIPRSYVCNVYVRIK